MYFQIKPNIYARNHFTFNINNNTTMENSYKSILLVCFLFLFSQAAVAQFTVNGTITDETSGEALVGVNVFHQQSQSGTIMRSIFNSARMWQIWKKL